MPCCRNNFTHGASSQSRDFLCRLGRARSPSLPGMPARRFRAEDSPIRSGLTRCAAGSPATCARIASSSRRSRWTVPATSGERTTPATFGTGSPDSAAETPVEVHHTRDGTGAAGTMPAIYNAVGWSSPARLHLRKTRLLGDRLGRRRMIRVETVRNAWDVDLSLLRWSSAASHSGRLGKSLS